MTQLKSLKATSFAALRSGRRLGLTWTELAVCLAILFVLVALIFPVTRGGWRGGARETARRMQCSNNLKQIGLALHNYEQKYKMLPPAYTVDADGNRLHGWRTLILPYLEEAALYEKVDFSKAWDDPANEAVRSKQVPAYQCPSNQSSAGDTTYLAIVGDRNILRPQQGRAFTEVVDGLRNTVMVVEADALQAVHWMSPQDASEDTFISSDSKSKTSHANGRNACMADGSVQFLSNSTARDTLQSLATVDGNEQPSPRMRK